MKTTNPFSMQQALEETGVVFPDPGEHPDGGVGVRLKHARQGTVPALRPLPLA
jgi:hypothetical protein